ncbi:MAG: MFS transporter [Hyphomicrobiales bacterium]
MLRLQIDFRSSQSRGIVAAIATITSVGLAISLSIPLLSFEMERRGIPTTVIGLNAATFGLAALLTTPFTSRIAQRLGFIRSIFLAISINAATFIGFYAVPDFWMWFPLRLISGLAVSILFVLSEFWISAIAPTNYRGLVIGIYVTVLSLGFAAGPVILTFTGTSGMLPYLVGAGLTFLSAVPLLLARNNAPQMVEEPSSKFSHFLIVAPVATGAALMFGAMESSAFALLPIYGLRLSYETNVIIFLASAMTLGNVVFQIPVGLLSDRMDRRKLLLTCSLVAVVGAILIPLFSSSPLGLMGLLFVWGGITGALYTVGLAHLGSRFSDTDLANANSAFVFSYALGMLVGPALAGLAMDLWNPHGFAGALALFSAVYAVLCISRMMGKRTA